MKIADELAQTYQTMQMMLTSRGDEQSAHEWSGRCIQLRRSLAHHETRNLRLARRLLAKALEQRAEAWTRIGRPTEALADYKEALDLTHGTKEEEILQAFNALTKARMGDLSDMALLGDKVRDRLEGRTRQEGENLYHGDILYYDAACIHAALAGLT